MVYINPKFNELRGTEVVRGASSHASYQVTETGKSLICTGTWNVAGFRQRNICVQSNERNRALALTSLHSADFDYEQQVDERSRRGRAAYQTLVICPDCEASLREIFTGAQSLTIHTFGIGDALELTALLRRKALSIRFLPPAVYRGQNPLIDEMKKLGTQVRYVDGDTDGLIVESEAPRERSLVCLALCG